MSILPIVERELRVAARKRRTYYLRGGMPILALILALPIYIYANAAKVFAMASAATTSLVIFNGLSWYALIMSLMMAVFLASDCLSEERREGTLGLLFLTDLKGYDIVLGKLMAIGLNSFYSLIAIFPMLSLCLLFGGVTGGEFWRMTLALVNALFCAVAAAIWVSSRHRTWHRSMAGTLALLVLFYGVLPFSATMVHARINPTHAQLWQFYMTGVLSLVSPVEPVACSHDTLYRSSAAMYWVSLLLSNITGCLFLWLASRHLPRSLENKPRVKSFTFLKMFLHGDKPGAQRQRQNRLLEINPVLWLLEDSPWLRATVWMLAVIGGGAMILITPLAGKFAEFASYFVSFPIYFLLKILFAVQVCRFFSEARRNGWLELMCCTPITTDEMVQGQWLALKRVFLWPVALLFLVNVCMSTMFQTHTTGSQFGMVHLLGSALDFIGLGWLGLALALSCKKPGTATGLTILFVLIVPMLVYCVPNVAFNVFYIAFGSAKLSHTFRLLASGERSPIVAVAKENHAAAIKT